MITDPSKFYLADGVYGEMVDSLTVRLWTERYRTSGQTWALEGRMVHEVFLEYPTVERLLRIMEKRMEPSVCPVPTDPEQKLEIRCGQCRKDIDFRKKEVFDNGVSYVCKACMLLTIKRRIKS
jgi:hypothetical protein